MTSFRCGSFCVALLSLGSLDSFNAHADTISTWNGGSGNWSAAGQWTPSRVPNNTASQSYDVTIGGGAATLDISPTINAFTLNGGLTQGGATGPTTLTVNGDAVVNGGIAGNSGFVGWRDSLVIGGNLTNNGYMQMSNTVSVAGHMNNSGTVILIPAGEEGGLGVGGTLVNTGTVQWGTLDGASPGGGSSLGALVNKGSIFIGPFASVGLTGPSGTTDIPKGASWEIGGLFNGFGGLTRIEGSLDIESTGGGSTPIPLTLGSPGSTIHNSGSFIIGSTYGTSVVNVGGNLSNTSDIEVAFEGRFPPSGPSTLNVAGTLTNQVSGTLNVNNPQSDILSPGALNVQNLINYGTANFQAGTAATAQFLQNSGMLSIFNDSAGDIGQLNVGRLKTAGGVINDNQGALVVGSGALPAGFTGYYQFANGILDEAGGALNIEGDASLNGTLDIMLGNGYKPVGTVFTVLVTGPGAITGGFSNVEGLVFDDGRERYLLTYNHLFGVVDLTVENNTTPEPGSVFLAVLGLAGILGIGAARRRASDK